jgi:hypothetical protein
VVLRFCVGKNIVGSTNNIVYDDGSLSFVDTSPDDCWLLDRTFKPGMNCMDTLFKLEHVKLTTLQPDECHVKAMTLSAPELVDVPWSKVLTPTVYKSFIKKLINSIIEALDNVSMNYYTGTWVPSGAIFDKLMPAKIDKKRWLELMRSEENATNRSVLETFEPGSDDFAKPIVYDRMKTRTGRLSVASGPQILTLKRDYRNLIASRFGNNGVIAYVDFASLEVRIILHESGRWFDEADIYTKLAHDIFGNNVDRAIIKGAVISELYGVSAYRLGKILKMGERDVQRFISVVRTYFDVDSLLARVKSQYAKHGYVKNRYGRKVLVDEPMDHMLVNSYVQSTGVDVSLLGFSNLVKLLEKKKIVAEPIFVLHDAMLLDVHKDELQNVIEATKTVRVKGYVQKFWLHVDMV